MTTYDEAGSRVRTEDPPADETQVHPPALGAESPYRDGDSYAEEDGYNPARQRERFGGVNWGAALFGWLITVSVSAVLSAGVAAVVTGLGRTGDVAEASTAGEPTTTGIVAAATLFALLVVAYYAGGYVAGRMSRFDGGKQGVAVWLTGLLLGAAAVGVGLLLGSESMHLAGPDLPVLPVPSDVAGMRGVVTVVAALLSSLLAAVAGGKVGCRYHRKVDDAAWL